MDKLDQIVKAILSIMMPTAFIGVVYMLFLSNITLDDNVREIMVFLLGTMTILVKEVFGFIFGSSQESKEKDKK